MADDPGEAIRIDVETSYLEGESSPEDERYVFAYTITIRNEGDRPARLLSRHWWISDADGNVEEVQGEGVVGEQPYLRPGEGFRYTSGAELRTSMGTMRGRYHLVDGDGEPFEARIPEFLLSVPRTLH